MQIISLEKGKVVFDNNQVIKKSSQKELETLKYAKKIIQNCNSVQIDNQKYKIKVPEIYDFSDEKIYMERCYGKNLEISLREQHNHKKGVVYTNSLLEHFINNNFFWKDFAPRNILIDEKEISIMDFERGITNKVNSLNEYFWDSVYEEYSAFLLPFERIYNHDNILQTNSIDEISIDSINSKRIRNILKQLGYEKVAPLSKYVLAIRMIIINEEPYIKENDIIFPLIELEDYISENGHEMYAKKIIGGYYDKKRNI